MVPPLFSFWEFLWILGLYGWLTLPLTHQPRRLPGTGLVERFRCTSRRRWRRHRKGHVSPVRNGRPVVEEMIVIAEQKLNAVGVRVFQNIPTWRTSTSTLKENPAHYIQTCPNKTCCFHGTFWIDQQTNIKSTHVAGLLHTSLGLLFLLLHQGLPSSDIDLAHSWTSFQGFVWSNDVSKILGPILKWPWQFTKMPKQIIQESNCWRTQNITISTMWEEANWCRTCDQLCQRGWAVYSIV